MAGPSLEALRFLLAESKSSVQGQVETIRSGEEKAAEIVRFNVLVLGVMVSALSLDAAADGVGSARAAQFAFPPLVGGLGALFASTLLAIGAFGKRDVSIGIAADDAQRALEYDVDEKETLRAAIQAYADGARENYGILSRASARLRSSLTLLSLGVLALSVASMALITLGRS